jgi:hypothetical protein
MGRVGLLNNPSVMGAVLGRNAVAFTSNRYLRIEEETSREEPPYAAGRSNIRYRIRPLQPTPSPSSREIGPCWMPHVYEFRVQLPKSA